MEPAQIYKPGIQEVESSTPNLHYRDDENDNAEGRTIRVKHFVFPEGKWAHSQLYQISYSFNDVMNAESYFR